jgi:hypothetical protein
MIYNDSGYEQAWQIVALRLTNDCVSRVLNELWFAHGLAE